MGGGVWGAGCIGRGDPPPFLRAPSLCPATVPQRQVPASLASVTDSNRPQPLWQPPPTACLTASVAASEGFFPPSNASLRGGGCPTKGPLIQT